MTIQLSKEQACILRDAARKMGAKPDALATLAIGWVIDEYAKEDSGLYEWSKDVLTSEPDVPGWLL